MIIIDEFLALMERGGPVMWVIFGVTWLACILLLERFFSIRKWRTNNHVNHQVLISLISDRSEHSLTDKQLDDSIHRHLGEQVAHLEGSLPTIAVLASLLPMLGLLGTVTGMIEVFHVITQQGTGDPKAMADGISQALLTTASGLITAIPIIFMHHLQVRQIKKSLLSAAKDIKVNLSLALEKNHEHP